MRKYILTFLVLLPLGVTGSHAAQAYTPDFSGEAFAYGGEELPGGGSYLGVDTRDVTADRLAALKLKDERGVEVTMVDQDAPAGKTGIKEHDVILSLNGANVDSVEQLRRMIRETPPGRVVTLGLSRDGQPITLKVQLADRRKAFAREFPGKEFKFSMPPMPPMPPMPDIDVPGAFMVLHSSMRSGLMIEDLTPQLAGFFGVKSGEGVLVRSVEKGSRAEQAGFRAGDVIVKVSEERISGCSDFTHALHARKGSTVSVVVVRDKKEQTLTLTLPERKQSGGLIEEEDLEFPDLESETRIDLGEVQAGIARLRPEMERAAEEVRLQAAEIVDQRPAMERAARQLCRQGKEMKEQMREMQRELREQLQRGFHRDAEI